jgi:GNAT superfamily N-acetyltransferase
VTVRHATDDDRDALRELGATSEAELERALAANALFVAEDEGEPVGFVTAWLEDDVARVGEVLARRDDAGRALVETAIENLRARGATRVLLTASVQSLSLYERLGFREESRNLALALDLPDVGGGRSYGSIHVQTDDVGAVERAVQQFVPRLPGNSRGSTVSAPRNGWIAVYDEACDRDPSLLRRLAKELSERLGVVLALGVEHDQVVRFVLLEAGRIVDEYLSVPEHYGPLPPGDAIALAANPRVVARLTGADPAAVRAVARTAASPDELPPAQTLLEEIAAAIGLEGADHGWEPEA